MVDYSRGKIYRIVPNCEHDPQEQYIGSTTKQRLSDRMSQHRIDYRRHNDGRRKGFTTSFTLFEKYGVENCSIILIENIHANSKEELFKKEREHIESNECINKIIPCRNKKEYYLDTIEERKATSKLWRENNRDVIQQKTRDKYWNNLESESERKREYYIKNKEKVLERCKSYSEKYRERYRELNNAAYQKRTANATIIECECGCVLKSTSKNKHIKSKKHQSFICQSSL